MYLPAADQAGAGATDPELPATNTDPNAAQNAGNPPTAGGAGNAGTPPAEVKFTQADLDRIAGDARKDGSKSAVAKALKDLGFESLEAAKAALAEADKLKRAQMSDTERLTAEKAEAERKATEALQSAQQAQERANKALIESEIISLASGRFANPRAVIKLVDASKLTLGEDGTVAGVAEQLDELAKNEPWTLLPKGASPNSIGRTNPPGTPPARTDADRKQEYFGGGRASIFKGGGVQKVIETQEGG